MGEDGGFARVVMIGAPRSFGSNIPQYSGAVLVYEGNGSIEKQTPMLIMQGMRSSHVQGITFVSRGNPRPRAIFEDGAGPAALYHNTRREDWVEAGVRTNPRSPQCVVAIDPFTPEFGGTRSDRYPSFEGYYGGWEWSNPMGSSAIHFEGCVFEGGYVGVAVSCPGGNANNVDKVQNAENFEFRDCYWMYNTVHFSQGQSQSRANNLHNPRMVYSWLCVDDGLIGPGGNMGINPTFSGAPNIGLTVYAFCLTFTGGNQFVLAQAHFENVLSIGKLGTGAAGLNLGGTFINCLFNLLSADTAIVYSSTAPASTRSPEIPFHFMTWGINIFDNCVFAATNTDRFIWRIWTNTGRAIFRGCHITTPTRNGRVQFGLGNERDWAMSFMHAYDPKTGAVYQDEPRAQMKVHGVGGVQVQVIQDAHVQSRGTVALADTHAVEVGDLVRLSSSSPTRHVPATLGKEHAYAMPGPLGYVSEVSRGGLTLEGLPIGFPFGEDVVLEFVTWSAQST